jgi:hypothetical protein
MTKAMAMRISLLLAGVLMPGLVTCGLAAETAAGPLTSHPRLWVTGEDLPRLRSWSTMDNPMYAKATSVTLKEAVEKYNSAFYPDGKENPKWVYDDTTNYDLPPALDDGAQANTRSGVVTEAYAEFFAYMSLVDPDAAKRELYAGYARNLLMKVMDYVAAIPAGAPRGTPFTGAFAVHDRSRWSGEAWGLTVDWIYPYLSAKDKKTIQKVFLKWAYELNNNYRAPLLNGQGTPNVMPDLRDVTNNYYSGHFRNLVMLSLCMDAADDPPADPAKDPMALGNTLRSYIPYLQQVWLKQMYEMYGPGGCAEGGAHPEGPYYGLENMAFLRQAALAMETAGYNSEAISGKYIKFFDLPYWDGLIDATIKSLPYSKVSIPASSYLGDVYQLANYGDIQHLYLGDTIALGGPIVLYDRAKGIGSPRKNQCLWLVHDAAPGGAAKFYQHASSIWPNCYASNAIMYHMTFGPKMALPEDPRPRMTTSFFAKGMGRMLDRTEWSANACIFTFLSCFLSEGHQHGYSGMFEFNRKNEWLTKELSLYGADNKATCSEYHNVLTIQNDSVEKVQWWEEYINARGGQWIYNGFNLGDPTLVVSMKGGFDYAQTDLTNLYNRPKSATDVTHASRAIVWLKPDVIVVYDRATSKTAGRFKKFNLWLPAMPVISDSRVTMTTKSGQRLYINPLSPAGKSITVGPIAEKINMIAEGEPMQYKLVIAAPTDPADVRFLTVLQGADSGVDAAPATMIQSTGGSAYAGAEVAQTAIMFAVDMKAAFTGTTYLTSSGVTKHIITGLQPGTRYDVTSKTVGDKMQTTVAAGTTYQADEGGVLDYRAK